MMLRGLLALSLLVPTATAPEPFGADPIPLVDCGTATGTAFRVGPHLLVTAKHVTKVAPCSIEGEPMHVIYTAPTNDYAILSDDRAGRSLRVDCGGFVANRQYAVLGHGRGVAAVVRVDVVATGLSWSPTGHPGPGEISDKGPYALLAGMFSGVPGQSGGPVVDAETGDAVGILSGGDWGSGTSIAVPLSATTICKRNVT